MYRNLKTRFIKSERIQHRLIKLVTDARNYCDIPRFDVCKNNLKILNLHRLYHKYRFPFYPKYRITGHKNRNNETVLSVVRI